MSDRDPNDVRPMLEYRPAADDRREFPIGHVMAGALLSLIFVPAAVAFGILANIHQSSYAPFLSIVGITVGVLVVIALATHRSGSRKDRGMAMGIWIGIGLAALIEGVCFISLSK